VLEAFNRAAALSGGAALQKIVAARGESNA
jgi:hypothetical protein